MDKITNLCNWLNTNEGVVSAILTVMTIIISVIALFISIKLGRIPYQKKLSAIPFYQEVDGEPTVDIMLVNYGLCSIVIEYITVLDKKKNNVGTDFGMQPVVLKPSESRNVLLHLHDSEGLIQKHGIDLNGNMTIEVHEYGGKVHKFNRGFPVG